MNKTQAESTEEKKTIAKTKTTAKTEDQAKAKKQDAETAETQVAVKESKENSIAKQFKKIIQNYQEQELSYEEMLEAGMHFGHQKSKWNSKMRENILLVKQGIHIINLEKTKPALNRAINFLKTVLDNNGTILFVSTKKQTKDLIQEMARYCEMPYIVERWIGGVLTNFETIRKRVDKLMMVEDLQAKGELKKYTKKEQAKFKEKLEKFNKKMGGIKQMKQLPDAVFVVDLVADDLAVKEAKRMGIPVVGFADTNTDPQAADIAIPANDDALKALKLSLGYIAAKIK
ncbi:MAG: 30S ribosomal protein S2 [Candidatus Moranbacteria bacterium]|nr:30S ribosomal protein S2 [Candidatus Moranbacteria bacterium]